MKEDTYMMHDIVSFVIRKVQIAIAFHHAVDSEAHLPLITAQNIGGFLDVDGVNLSGHCLCKNSTTLTSP